MAGAVRSSKRLTRRTALAQFGTQLNAALATALAQPQGAF